MNTTELAAQIAEDNGITKVAAKAALDMVTEGIIKGLGADGSVRLHGFGTIALRETQARQIRNPQNGEPMDLPAGHRVVFKPSASLKEAVR